MMSVAGVGIGMGTLLLIPVLYAGLKIAAGILVLRYGKQYAKPFHKLHPPGECAEHFLCPNTVYNNL